MLIKVKSRHLYARVDGNRDRTRRGNGRASRGGKNNFSDWLQGKSIKKETFMKERRRKKSPYFQFLSNGGCKTFNSNFSFALALPRRQPPRRGGASTSPASPSHRFLMHVNLSICWIFQKLISAVGCRNFGSAYAQRFIFLFSHFPFSPSQVFQVSSFLAYISFLLLPLALRRPADLALLLLTVIIAIFLFGWGGTAYVSAEPT